MVLVTSVSRSFMRLCAGICTVIFACNQAVFRFKAGVLLVCHAIAGLADAHNTTEN